jgi:hypothetical protein
LAGFAKSDSGDLAVVATDELSEFGTTETIGRRFVSVAIAKGAGLSASSDDVRAH